MKEIMKNIGQNLIMRMNKDITLCLFLFNHFNLLLKIKTL